MTTHTVEPRPVSSRLQSLRKESSTVNALLRMYEAAPELSYIESIEMLVSALVIKNDNLEKQVAELAEIMVEQANNNLKIAGARA